MAAFLWLKVLLKDYSSNQKKLSVLYLKYGHPRSPDRRTFAVLLPCFYHKVKHTNVYECVTAQQPLRCDQI